jgi:hypothetical protein
VSPSSRIGRQILRTCLCPPVQEIQQAAQLLDEAVTEHLSKDFARAASLFSDANLEAIRSWTESVWGKDSPYLQPEVISDAPPYLPKDQRVPQRMPSLDERRRLQERDGLHCRFCGIPLIRWEIRERVRKSYPQLNIWGRKNSEQHAAFQAMWLQYDHVLPHCRGGDNSFDNLIITCAPCNYGRMQFTLEELGLIDPRTRDPVRTSWDGLERFR